MTSKPQKLRFDDASAISKGARDYQEDAFISDFSNGADMSFAVLADGMGGHAAGDIASKIVVTEIFSELIFRRGDANGAHQNIPAVLRNATQSANECLRAHVESDRETAGMGATLVSCVVVADALYWISIGDSPLFLFRDNTLSQLNEDHSLGPHIDMMVRSGMMSAAEGENHPERCVLTSVLSGQEIPQIDCPSDSLRLRAGDTLIIASDGLQFLANDKIAQILRERPLCRSGEVADALMDALGVLNDPDLDNVTLSVIQVKTANLGTSDCSETDRAIGHDKSVIPWPLRSRRDPQELVSAARNRVGAAVSGDCE